MKKMIRMAAAVLTLVGAFSRHGVRHPVHPDLDTSTDIQPSRRFTSTLILISEQQVTGVSATAAYRDANTIMMGPTIGILPFEKIQAEVGLTSW